MNKFTGKTVAELTTLFDEAKAKFDALTALDSPTPEQVDEAEALANDMDDMLAAKSETLATEKERADKFAALRARKFNSEPEAQEDPPKEEPPAEDPPKEDPPKEDPPAEDPPKETQAAGGVATLAAKTKRPEAPAFQRKAMTITAAADVPEFASGQRLDDLESVAKAVIGRARGFTAPSGDGRSVDLHQFGTAKFALDFEPELIVDRWDDAQEAIDYATDETRLPGGSLTAAAGWCSPSETVYDLEQDATPEGMISLPEIGVRRGGIRFAQSPNFATFYANPGFIQTEAQAIAGTTKPCVEVPCPTFTDVRLDAEGICIKVPILLNSAYPEVVANFISGTMIAHQHWINANVIGRLVTAAGAARDATAAGIGTTAGDTLGVLEIMADQTRQTYRLAMNKSLEVVVPFWVKGAVRNDLSLRTGQTGPVSDQQINAHFASRNLNVQYLYDWQLLPTVDVGGTATVNEALVYPDTFQALLYPAGTFVKGTSDVITLNTVYDAASLATNTYTGLFAEQGLLVAQKKFDAKLVTLPVCSSGRTGANDLTCATGKWA